MACSTTSRKARAKRPLRITKTVSQTWDIFSIRTPGLATYTWQRLTRRLFCHGVLGWMRRKITNKGNQAQTTEEIYICRAVFDFAARFPLSASTTCTTMRRKRTDCTIPTARLEGEPWDSTRMATSMRIVTPPIKNVSSNGRCKILQVATRGCLWHHPHKSSSQNGYR